MNALSKLLLIVCLVMASRTEPTRAGEWSLFPTELAEATTEAAPAARPVVSLYLAENLPARDQFSCPACDRLKQKVKAVQGITFIEPKPPGWVRSFPCIHWNGEDGQSYYRYGDDLDTFLKQFEQTNPAACRKFKISAEQSEQVNAAPASYPLGGRNWSINGDASPSRAVLIEHLQQDGIHAGRFSDTYLNRQSRASLISLHGDHHDGNVAFSPDPIPRAPRRQFIYQAPRKRRRLFSSGCPSGRCPY